MITSLTDDHMTNTTRAKISLHALQLVLLLGNLFGAKSEKNVGDDGKLSDRFAKDA